LDFAQGRLFADDNKKGKCNSEATAKSEGRRRL
jgi:hypothetical protein